MAIAALLGLVVAVDAKSQGFSNPAVITWGVLSFILPVFVVPAYILYRVVSKIDDRGEGLVPATIIIYLILSAAAVYLIVYNVQR